MKVYIMIILFFAMVTAGYLKAFNLKRTVNEIQNLITLIENLKIKVAYYKTPVKELLSESIGEINNSNVLERLALNLKTNESASDAWFATDIVNVLGEETSVVCDEFFRYFGGSGIEGQAALCENTIYKLKACKEKSLIDLTEKGKLYKSLGFLAGAFTVILFI